jgi:hypothetical protein
MATLGERKFYTPYLILLAILGVILVFINTATYGPGVTSDGMEYLAAADNLARGQGFTNFHGGVYILWPPLYPLILAGVHALTGLDAFVVGWILNALCFGATIFLAGILLKLCFPDRLVWAALGASLTLFFLSYLVSASNIASDPLFVVLVLAFFIACHYYLTTSGRLALWLMLILAALSPLQRFLGVCVVVVGALVVFARHRDAPFKAAGKAAAFGLAASLPTLVWVIGRNYRLYGSLTGPRHLGDAFVLRNVAYCVRQMLRWFVPLNVIDRLPLWLIPALVLVILLLIARKRHWSVFFKRLSGSSQWPMLAFSAIYLIIIILTTITDDHLHPYDDRFQSVIFVPILALLFSAMQDLIIAPLEERKFNLVKPLLATLIVVWSAYPLFTMWKYVQKSRQDGEAIYNLYNLRVYQESPVVIYLKEHPPDPGVPIYSNTPEAAYFFTRQVIQLSPRDLKNHPRSQAYLLERYPGWPQAQTAYLVWFPQRGDRRYNYTPEELDEVAILQPLIKSKKKGAIYLVFPRPQN